MNRKLYIGLSLFVAILIITYFSGPVPTQPVYASSIPATINSPGNSEWFIKERDTACTIRKDNEAQIVWASTNKEQTEYCILYLHGFGASHWDANPLHKMIAQHYGANLYLTRMMGHGLVPPECMLGFTPENTWNKALEDLSIAKKLGKKVIIMSTSTGGTLALKLAAEFPEDIFSLINISPNIKDEQIGSGLLNSPWGTELTWLVFMGDEKKMKQEEDSASMYWDTLIPTVSLIQLQHLLETTMVPETYRKVKCPVLTLYFYKDFIKKDWRVDIDEYPEVYENLSTPDSLKVLVEMQTPGTHFIGSSIKSKDYEGAQKEILKFCDQKLRMKAQK